jgi:hypothetical protein
MGSTLTSNANNIDLDNTAFVIGNGADANSRSDALVVKFDGTTIIAGSVSASSFIGDGSGLISLPLIVDSITEGGNTGVRLSSANANLYGDIGNNALDLTYSNTNVSLGATGDSSVAFGLNSTASGDVSIALGNGVVSSGNNSFASGIGTNAIGSFSTAMGINSSANGQGSTAMGSSTVASGLDSTAMGFDSEATGDGSIAMGVKTTASGGGSTAMGENTIASGGTSLSTGFQTESSGPYSATFGVNSIAQGNTSAAMGYGTIASDYGSLVIGVNNLMGSTLTSNANNIDLDNTAFVIGNGADANSRSDALVVKFDGTTTISGDLNVNSDARLKANIISLGATLSKVLQIDGKSYTMKKDKNEKQKIGLLAQDIEKVFPELVSESNGIKSVNYQGIVPILINALKEQDEKMKVQQSQIDKLENLVQELIK